MQFSKEEVAEVVAMQRLINSGAAWKLEGSVGRQAMALLDAGLCILGRKGQKDYWGNYVPSRKEVKNGTKGSVGYAAERQGEAWARKINRLK